MNKLPILLLVLLPVFCWARSDSLVSELTRDHVDISARYTGDEITLFGALSAPGQIVVKLRSPEQPAALQYKGKVGPFWLGQGKYGVSGVPALYYLLSSAPIDSFVSEAQRQAHGFDLVDALTDLRFDPPPPDAQREQLKSAVLRLKKGNRDYRVNPEAVKILGQRLYSTVIRLPAQLPLGEYQVDIFLVRNGKVTASEHQRIRVEQVRLEHWVSKVAAKQPWIFGLVFTAGMMLLGLVLGILLDRGNKA